MNEWKEVRLGDFMEFNPKESLKKGTLAKKVTMDLLIPHSRDIYNYDVEPYSGGAKFRNGDTIMARITPCLENGKHAFVSFLDDNEVAYGSTEYFVMRGKDGVSDNYYVYYLTHSPLFKATAIKSMVGSSGRQRAQVEVLQNLIMPVPETIFEQRCIASILSSLDDKIAVNRRICVNLEAQAQAIFKNWFVDFAPFKDGKFVESELGMIPEGWRVGKLEDVSSFISRGLSPKYQTDTNEIVLGQTCVRNNIVTLDNAREHNPKQNTDKRVQKWDVLLNSTGIGSLGRVGVVYFDDNNVCFDSHLTVVRSRQESFRYYLGRNLLSRQKESENMAVGSTGQTELPKKDVLVMPILIPSDSSLASFNVLIDDIGNEMYSLLQENRRLSTLRDTLIPKLMSGQIKL